MKVFLIPNLGKDTQLRVTRLAAELLHQRAVEVYLPHTLSGRLALPWAVFAPEAEACKKADVILTVGGDGTILHTAKNCLASQTPILGVNLGRTGFLATCEVDELPEKLKKLADREYQIEERRLLSAYLDGQLLGTALNDIILYNDNRCQTMDFSIFCDGIQVSATRGDGVILSTPTGSTAYSLSAGGPILDSRIDGFVVTTICAHSLKNPPIVFSADRRIAVCAEGRDGAKAIICCDGQELTELAPGKKLNVQFSPQRLPLISFSSAEQFEAIDNKLKGR